MQPPFRKWAPFEYKCSYVRTVWFWYSFLFRERGYQVRYRYGTIPCTELAIELIERFDRSGIANLFFIFGIRSKITIRYWYRTSTLEIYIFEKTYIRIFNISDCPHHLRFRKLSLSYSYIITYDIFQCGNTYVGSNNTIKYVKLKIKFYHSLKVHKLHLHHCFFVQPNWPSVFLELRTAWIR